MFLKKNENRTTYTYPIVKMTLSVAVITAMMVMMENGVIIAPENAVLDFLLGLIRVVIVLSCVLCIYLSFVECITISERREVKKLGTCDFNKIGKKYSVEKALKLAESNDIISIHIVLNNRLLEIGSSSKCKIGSSHFYDKRYYFGDKAFESIDALKEELANQNINDDVIVVMIDGVKVAE